METYYASLWSLEHAPFPKVIRFFFYLTFATLSLEHAPFPKVIR